MNTPIANRSTFVFNIPCITNECGNIPGPNNRVAMMNSVVRMVLEKLPETFNDPLKDVKVWFDGTFSQTVVTFFFAGNLKTDKGVEGWEVETEGKFCFNITQDLTEEMMARCLFGLIHSELTERSCSRPARPLALQEMLGEIASTMCWV